MNEETPIAKLVLSKLQDMGMVEQKLLDILDNDVFENLSKHDTCWHHVDPDIADKLDLVRRQLSCIRDGISEVLTRLRWGEEE